MPNPNRIRTPVCITLSAEAVDALAEVSQLLGLNKSATVDQLVVEARDRLVARKEAAAARLAASNKPQLKTSVLFEAPLA